MGCINAFPTEEIRIMRVSTPTTANSTIGWNNFNPIIKPWSARMINLQSAELPWYLHLEYEAMDQSACHYNWLPKYTDWRHEKNALRVSFIIPIWKYTESSDTTPYINPLPVATENWVLKTLPVIPSLHCWVKIAGYFHIFHAYNPYKENQQGPLLGGPAPWSTGVPKTLCWVPDWMQLQTTRVSCGTAPWWIHGEQLINKKNVININGGYKHTYLWGI